VKTWGISESAINDMFLPLYSLANPTVAIYVKADGIHIRIAAKAAMEDTARKMITPVEEKVRAVLGDAVWGADSDTMEAVAYRLLSEKKLSLAIIEGYSGGQLINTICDSSAGTPFFKGGVVMEQGMLELLEKISRSTSFLAVGGAVAVMFLLIFAQSIFGSKTTHSQLEKLIGQTDRMNRQLEDIARSLKEAGRGGDEEGKKGLSDEETPADK
jgi:nicotinamide-nucleotide amidase